MLGLHNIVLLVSLWSFSIYDKLTFKKFLLQKYFKTGKFLLNKIVS